VEGADFTADRRLVWLSLLGIPVGLLCAVLALALLRLIGLFTNLFYYQRLAFPADVLSPAASPLGPWMIAVPVVGGLIIGLMARYGSDRIRGHGIPEALEAILIGRSRMSPRVAVLKPLSSAISIGSGGPFGAEGPIIMTGGACGSLIAQAFHITAAERKTLLVAGAGGGMSATFGTPVAAALLAVELLLFEWKPRSFVPVALASAVAAMVRPFLGLGAVPLFSVPIHATPPGLAVLLGSVAVGVLAGGTSMALTTAVYTMEDLFNRLPIHWMWWPAIGGIAVGLGGWLEPRALGVGYDLIAELLRGDYALRMLIVLLVVKAVIWAVALGSGTSGGVLAPLLIIGGAIGGLESSFLPGGDPALWPLLSMAAVMGGTMRSPFTGIVFALELTYDVRLLLPLLIAVVVAHALTVLFLKRSILTEKVARRGHHISREYSLDPLERLAAEQIMTPDPITVAAALPIRTLVRDYFLGTGAHRHQGYPVVGADDELVGIVTKSDLLQEWLGPVLQGDDSPLETGPVITYDVAQRSPITILPRESCRTAAERMAAANVGRLLVVSREDPKRLLGLITRSDLLKARARALEEESARERFIAFGRASG
jgi:chloride channel protein, CIC family